MAACFFSQKDLKCINFVIWRQTKSFGHDWLIELLYRHQIFFEVLCSAPIFGQNNDIKDQRRICNKSATISEIDNTCHFIFPIYTFFMLLHIFSIPGASNCFNWGVIKVNNPQMQSCLLCQTCQVNSSNQLQSDYGKL